MTQQRAREEEEEKVPWYSRGRAGQWKGNPLDEGGWDNDEPVFQSAPKG